MWEAYKVKANRGAAGVDGQSIEDFERDLINNLYRIWNRMSSGSYFPPPVRPVDIPTGGTGKTRPLGIPTFADRVLQPAVAHILEAISLTRIFSTPVTVSDRGETLTTPCRHCACSP